MSKVQFLAALSHGKSHNCSRAGPVRRGESLLKIADVTGDWEVALEIPDKKYGYVADAQKAENRDDLIIGLALASNPSKQYETRFEFGVDGLGIP